jgi:hypothetical protein
VPTWSTVLPASGRLDTAAAPPRTVPAVAQPDGTAIAPATATVAATAKVQPGSTFVHPSLAEVLPLAGALASRRPRWSTRELLRLTELIGRGAPGTLRLIARHDPAHRWYARLALTDDVEVWLLGWTPKQATRPHDHGGASGAFVVVDGMLTESYRDGPVRSRRTLLTAGRGSAFGPERVHLVANPGPGNATSVHAYSPPLLPLGERPSLDPA